MEDELYQGAIARTNAEGKVSRGEVRVRQRSCVDLAAKYYLDVAQNEDRFIKNETRAFNVVKCEQEIEYF